MFKSQIESILKLDYTSKKYFKGVYSIDQLPRRERGAYVINLDNHDEPGSHWVAVFDDGENVEYFDSFGVHPTCLKFLGPNAVYSTANLQPLMSNACGFYCVYFIIKRSYNFPMNDILTVLSKTDSHYVVKNYLYSRYSLVFK
jgi:hypothetical protein